MYIMKQQESGQRRIPRHRRSKALPLADPPELLADPLALLADPLALLAVPLAAPLAGLAALAVPEAEEKQKEKEKGKVNQFLRY